MSAQGLFGAIQHSALSDAISKLDHWYGAIAQLGHIAGLILVLSSIALVNLRLLGFGLVNQPVSKLAGSTRKLIWIGLALLAVSGLFVFIPAALLYYVNPFFWYKFELLALALIVQLTLFSWVTKSEEPHPLLGKATAVLSLTLWFGVGAAARVIGFLN